LEDLLRDASIEKLILYKTYFDKDRILFLQGKVQNYMELMNSIIDVDQLVWRDSMIEEYTSIMRNDVCNVVSRLEGKSIVSSKWLYTIKNVADLWHRGV
jgi:hypothetical protein